MNTSPIKRRVVYLFGAGASHASIQARKSMYSILTNDLNQPLVDELRPLVTAQNSPYRGFSHLLNEILTNDADLEHLITFLDESPSVVHRRFADELRNSFYSVLKTALDAVEDELATDRFALYAMLLDMYNIPECPESLQGILTLNYDDYIEAAVNYLAAHSQDAVDYGIDIRTDRRSVTDVELLKLHGSFTWRDTWPIRRFANSRDHIPNWIPPGIQKAKERYPFNLLWGRAREMLRCDVLRIVGCRLSPNDWDLIALLFTTRHGESGNRRPYTVEIIDAPARASELKHRYPYLDVQSLVDIRDPAIGTQLVGELVGGMPRPPESLSPEEVQSLYKRKDENWFRLWLQQMAEHLGRDLGTTSLTTPSGTFLRIWEEMYG